MRVICHAWIVRHVSQCCEDVLKFMSKGLAGQALFLVCVSMCLSVCTIIQWHSFFDCQSVCLYVCPQTLYLLLAFDLVLIIFMPIACGDHF